MSCNTVSPGQYAEETSGPELLVKAVLDDEPIGGDEFHFIVNGQLTVSALMDVLRRKCDCPDIQMRDFTVHIIGTVDELRVR